MYRRIGRDRGGDRALCTVRHRLSGGCFGGGRKDEFDIGGFNRKLVLGNEVVFGTVNANRRHYENAARALAKANPGWLDGLISRRVPLSRWHEAFVTQPDDIKVVIDFST